MGQLSAQNIGVSFDGRQIIKDVSLHLEEGEIVSLLGVSGGGKTTIFNCLAGLLVPDTGKVFLDDTDITGKPGKISYMMQKDLLLPHYTVLDNACLGLLIKGKSKKESRAAAQPLFAEFGLAGTQKKYPHQLSGGMRQRVALLRTYLASDGVALLDEPFSALDAITKTAVQTWYLDVMEKINLSTLFITHDIHEAVLLSDRIYILAGNPGLITDEIQICLPGSKKDRDPASPAFLQYKKELQQKTAVTAV
ncbi:MAG: ABC transporter ATP-binding protein [Ruminococcaceae bacterium]|nr:ABC transporter ATP-binding protein [Oscillospiraceae bacterium]